MKFQVNDQVNLTRQFSLEDVDRFAAITGDFNPVHVDDDYAARTIFKKRICHGMLVSSLFSALLGTKLPGEGSIYVGQDLKFIKPVYIGDTITAIVKITAIIKEKNRIILSTEAINQNNEIVITGEAKILFPKLEEHL